MATVTNDLAEWLRESLRSGLLFGRWDEPLDAYGQRIVRAILAEVEAAATPSPEKVDYADHRCPEIKRDSPHGAFVCGAKWWEFQSTGGTMWASDRDKAWAEAERRYGATPVEAPAQPEGEKHMNRADIAAAVKAIREKSSLDYAVEVAIARLVKPAAALSRVRPAGNRERDDD